MGFLCSEQIDYRNKTYEGYLDLYRGVTPVTNEGNLSNVTRTTTLYDNAAINFIYDHANTNPNDPFFIYFAHQNPHIPLTAPDYFAETAPCAVCSVLDRILQLPCALS
jgi:hypothetical protein